MLSRPVGDLVVQITLQWKAKVADCCPLLEDLDVTGSFGITNIGVQWFCTGTYNPNHMYHGAPGNLLKKS